MSAPRLYAMGGEVGLVQQRRSRETGAIIRVYHGEQSGIETADPQNPWVTVCQTHGTCVCHPTLTLARAWAAEPTTWCEPCREAKESEVARA